MILAPIRSQDVLLSVWIGAEVFAIAALWPLSAWAAAVRSRVGFVAAIAVVLACVLLCTHGRGWMLAMQAEGGPWIGLRGLAWGMLPLLIAFPDAVCVASAQSLIRVGMPVQRARAMALAVSTLTVVVAPIAALAMGCRLAQAC